MVEWAMKGALRSGSFLNELLGKNTMLNITASLKKMIPAFPLWSNQLRAAPALPRLAPVPANQDAASEKGYTQRSPDDTDRSEEHTSELQSLMRISYAVFCLKKKKQH